MVINATDQFLKENRFSIAFKFDGNHKSNVELFATSMIYHSLSSLVGNMISLISNFKKLLMLDAAIVINYELS
jgi:hypothetical protein